MAEWTDDLSIPIPPDRSVAALVTLVLDAVGDATPIDEIVGSIAERFSLSVDDAELAYERVGGGLVRAATRNPANCPPRDQDPVAWESFHRGMADPSLITRMYPQFTIP